MRIDGREIASEIAKKLKYKVDLLKKKKITPHLKIILVGDNPASLSYIKQKRKIGKNIGVKVSLLHLDTNINQEKLFSYVQEFNYDNNIHGIIIQRPVLIEIDKSKLNNIVAKTKDVDGFCDNSIFDPPIALAVIKILQIIYKFKVNSHQTHVKSKFFNWLKDQTILIIGRGETGGKPIAEYFAKINVKYTIAHSKTSDIFSLIDQANIIISAVGKKVKSQKSKVKSEEKIFINVGMRKENGKLKADFEEKFLKDLKAIYTPVPGGVGPVNVICLFENLLQATE